MNPQQSTTGDQAGDAQVEAQLARVGGREELYQNLLEHEDDLRETYQEFNSTDLREQLDLVGDTLEQKKRYLEDVQSPEKKGLFRRAWEKVKGFAKDHPIVTTLLVLALAAGGVAA